MLSNKDNSHFVEKNVNLVQLFFMIMLKEIFTWWNGQTFGTRIWSYFNGVLAGSDGLGNKYYKNKNDTKRWVIYNGTIESTQVSPEWNNWLRYTSLTEPSKTEKYDWQKEHIPNLTGTSVAYDPEISKDKTNKNANNDDYKKWVPEN